jgi:hypothetical protein
MQRKGARDTENALLVICRSLGYAKRVQYIQFEMMLKKLKGVLSQELK